MITVLTIKAVSDVMSAGLPRYQRQANLKWLKAAHRLLKDGGQLDSPLFTDVIVRRMGDGFIIQPKV